MGGLVGGWAVLTLLVLVVLCWLLCLLWCRVFGRRCRVCRLFSVLVLCRVHHTRVFFGVGYVDCFLCEVSCWSDV